MSISPFNPFAAEATAAVPETAEFDPLSSPFGDPNASEEFSFDLTNASASGLIEPGPYLAMVSEVIKTMSKAGDPMIVFTFQILATGNKEKTTYENRTIKRHCVLKPEAMGIIANTTESLGLGKAGAPVSFKKEDAMNRLCYIVIAPSTYNGAPSSNLSDTKPFDPVGSKYKKPAV